MTLAQLVEKHVTDNYQLKNPQFKAWETPPDFFAKLDAEFRFTFDAASSHHNHLTSKYATEDGIYRSQDRIIDGMNGLTYNWQHERVFCNPPYDATLPNWLEKADARKAEITIMLLPPSTDVAWFTDYLWDFAGTLYTTQEQRWGMQWNVLQSDILDLYFSKGRLKFWHPGIKEGFKLVDYQRLGNDIFDFSLPHQPGPAPRAGNLVAVFKR